MPKITAKTLKKAMQKASEKALRMDWSLGLTTYEVHDGYLVCVDATGKKTRIRKAVFGLRKIGRQVIKLNKS